MCICMCNIYLYLYISLLLLISVYKYILLKYVSVYITESLCGSLVSCYLGKLSSLLTLSLFLLLSVRVTTCGY